MIRVATLVGSLRADSINLKFARALHHIAANSLDFDIVPLDDLPMYNNDLWKSPPPAVIGFKERIERADAVLFVTPEYNRSIPSVLKNAIDWAAAPKIAMCGLARRAR